MLVSGEDGRGAFIRVLIVDDDPSFVDAVRPSLQHLGAREIVVASNGSDGVAAANEHEVDVALVDIGLPDRSGLSVGREIMDLNPRMLVVAMAAVKDAMIARTALKLGFAAYLPKDISLDIFAQGLQKVLRGQRLDLLAETRPRPPLEEPLPEPPPGDDIEREIEAVRRQARRATDEGRSIFVARSRRSRFQGFAEGLSDDSQMARIIEAVESEGWILDKTEHYAFDGLGTLWEFGTYVFRRWPSGLAS